MKINLIFKLFLLITLFTITSVESRLYVYNETTSTQAAPRVWSAISYPSDSTLVFKIIHRAPSNDTTQVYLQEKLSLRILFQNGTVNSLDLDLRIPSINYILRPNWSNQDIDPLKIYSIKHGYILVTYINTTNSSDISTYEEWGMIIDWNGNIISKQKFGDSYIFNNIWNPQSNVVSNVNGDKGWLFVNTIRDSYNVNLKQFTMNGTGISLLSEAIISIESLSSGTAQVKVIPTMDEGYAIILANTTRSNNLTNTTVSNNITTTTDPLAVGGQMFIYNLPYSASSVNAPKLLYQTPLDNLLFLALQCDVDFVNVGHSCVLTLRQNTTTSPDISAPTYYVKVSFLSSGSVININSINSILPTVSPNVTRWTIHSLPYGGYLLTTNLAVNNNTGLVVYGYLYDDTNQNTTQWDLGEPAPTSLKGVLQILANNTLVVAQKEDLGGWSLLVSELPKFTAAIDKGYSNLHIQGTVPQIGQQITPMDQITINYYKAVKLSGGSISVYLTQDGAKDILRQTVVGTDTRFCSISSDGLTINVKMISSAFSQQNGKYYIKVDNNFVQSKEFQEPLMGIQENIWKFTTAPQEEMVAVATTGILRLTPDGTDYFETLDSAGQTQFFNTLIQEFADILPIQSTRLSTNGRTQIDVSVLPLRQLILSINIEKTKDPTSKSVASIIKDLNAMITYKDVTPINNGNSTKYLDSSYGLQPKQNIWEKYKLRFLGVFLGVALLITLFLLAQRRESKGRNIAVLQLGLIIFDLVVDVLFIVNNGRDVESLYIPSVIFLTVPIALNAMLAFAIISKENTRLDFYTWFSEHGKVASIFTVLAGVDIDALTILHSNLAGFAAFRAPFSNSAITKIFWGACAKIFLEDLPQVIIQILYQQRTVTYDIIPLLTLISSCLNLTINIIGRTYQATNIVRHKGRRDTSSFDEDFGNISDDQTGALNKEPLTREHDKSDERIESNSDIGDSQRAGFNLKDRFKEIKLFKKY